MGISQVPAATSSSLPNWVELSNNQTGIGTGGVTYSGLSGYNHYRLVMSSFQPAGNLDLRLRINGLTTSIYQFRSFQFYNGNIAWSANPTSGGEAYIKLNAGNSGGTLNVSTLANLTIDFWNANSTSVFKNVTYKMDSSGNTATPNTLVDGAATARTSNVISSITILTSTNTLSYDATAGGAALYGAN